jgi:bifunctional non-homologous end joining protein LigD
MPIANDKLTTYKEKRDFRQTEEPSGQDSVKSSNRRRFVIHKSWAVTKGPSLDPHDKRLAVEVEDHPLDYGDFEGTIPKGQYGGGTVMLWDRGYWEPEGTKGPEQALGKAISSSTLRASGCMAVLSWSAWPTIGNGTSAQTGS